MKQIARALLLFGSVALYPLMDNEPAKAQIADDGTLSTAVTSPDGSNFTIENGDRRGGNLFHSFREFSVPTGGSAFFNNAADIENIINRVTGGSVSSIDGLIRANCCANVFLLNPAGIIFGPNASLNIGGSFYGSTADSLVFPEGEFSATDTQAPPLLTINAPIGLNFRDNPGDIRVSPDNTGQSFANLTVGQGQNISLIGGNVNIDRGLIFAPGGRVNLGGLSVAGEVKINSDGSLTFPNGIARADVSLTNGTYVNVTSNNGGAVTVNARNIEILSGSIIFAGIIPGNQQADARAGDIIINATDKVSIAGEVNSTSAIGNIVGDLFGTDFSSSTPTRGNAGNISIDANELEGTGSFVIGSVANGEGNAGKVTITGRQSVSLTGGGVFGGILSIVGPSALGNGADITITTPSLSLSDNKGILASTAGKGNAGNVFINANDSILLNNGSQLQATTLSQGNAGNIVINAENADIALDNQSLFSTSVFLGASGRGGDINIKGNTLSLQNGSGLLTNTTGQVTTEQLADAGNIKINVSNSVNVGGGSFLVSSTSGQGNAGNVEINAAREVVFNGASIRTTVEQLSEGLAVDFTQQRQGGDINITASSLSLANGGQLSATTLGQGNAGNIVITASDRISADNSLITSNIGNFDGVAAKGNVGSISLTAKSVSFTNTAQLQAGFFSNTQGEPGLVSVKAEDSISFDGTNTGIFSDAYSGSVGGGSDILLQAKNISLTNGAVLNADNFGEGNGGNITIEANNLTLRNGNITAATSFGEGGNINLTVGELLQMRDNSLISARAFEDANGGNININAGFVIAYPSQTPNNGNDIIASAERGRGGNININTQQIFGLQERRATPGNGTNDIDASSEFGLSGEVVITNLVDDINQGVVESPDNVVEPETMTAQACSAAGRVARGESNFTITGRGGLPALATDPLTSDQISIGEDDTEQSSKKSSGGVVTVIEQPNPPSSKDIVPARGMIVNEKGEVVLTAYPTPNTSQRTPTSSVSCTGS